jgi:hypothetical protein
MTWQQGYTIALLSSQHHKLLYDLATGIYHCPSLFTAPQFDNPIVNSMHLVSVLTFIYFFGH